MSKSSKGIRAGCRTERGGGGRLFVAGCSLMEEEDRHCRMRPWSFFRVLEGLQLLFGAFQNFGGEEVEIGDLIGELFRGLVEAAEFFFLGKDGPAFIFFWGEDGDEQEGRNGKIAGRACHPTAGRRVGGIGVGPRVKLPARQGSSCPASLAAIP